jgi:CheY-like chemotaxis protein
MAPRVLVVDDVNALAQAVERLILAIHPGATVEVFGSALTAMARSDEALFDLAVLDLQLGDGSGVDVARRLRERQPALPIVFVTGAPDSPGASEARALGPRAVLEKPYPPEALREIVRSVLGGLLSPG